MNFNYIIIPLFVANIFFTAYVAQKVFYNNVEIIVNEEIYTECQIEIENKVEVENKIKNERNDNLNWYSNDCDIQRMNMIRALNHYERGLITLPKAKHIRDHYRKICN